MEQLLQLDGNLLLFIQEYLRTDAMTPFWKFITFLGDVGWFWIVLSVLLLIPKRTRRLGVTCLVSLVIGTLITNVALKNIVARIRPYEVVPGLQLLIEKQPDFSFPSGHSCASFAVAMVIWKLSPKVWGVLALVLASLIAFSRLYVGVHYPSDVVAGILIGIFSSWLAVKIAKEYEKRKHKKKNGS